VDRPVPSSRKLRIRKLTTWEAFYALDGNSVRAFLRNHHPASCPVCRPAHQPIGRDVGGGGNGVRVQEKPCERPIRRRSAPHRNVRQLRSMPRLSLIFPVTGPGIAVVIGLGTTAMLLLGREDDIVTTGITTTVVLVVAAMRPEQAWQQPILRLFDTVVGIAVGVACKWCASYAFYRTVKEPVR
jgi:hypothetical protein